MELHRGMAPLRLLRSRRLVNTREVLLDAQADPVRSLIRRRDEQIGDILRRLDQARDLQKGTGGDPSAGHWD